MTDTKRRVVVTGLGVVTSLGLNVEESWEKMLKGTPGIRRITLPQTASSPVQAVGEVADSDWTTIKNEFREEAQEEGERRTLFALWAAQSAMNDAGIPGGGGEKYGIVLAAGLGINRLEDIQGWINHDRSFDMTMFGKEHKAVHRESIMKNNSHRPSSLIARKFGLHSINCTVTTACASATQALGIGYRSIQRGDADLVLAGGADSMINPIGLVFFVLLNAAAVSPENPGEACRPFDRKRAGLVMGEGAGIAVLEERSHAIKRGATIYAELAGYGSSMDAYQVTAPLPRGEGAELSMRSALTDARLKPDNIDYINAHGTSTKLNDAAETLAIKRVFGDHAYRLSVSSSKSMIGHLLAASGGPEFVYTTLSVYRDEIHPTINLKSPDPKCDLDYVPNVKRSRTVGAALSNSFGFGGQNASIIVKKYAE
ncbi:MAG: beta-ketoacyl-[acyl-carrier-protein] synthase family protein [Nitrospiraceae bacterium]|nr:MAG: beta-ketoacyl-[acyl-carrier-protein] synthase family protein [Nitrospiraceae bacterium]